MKTKASQLTPKTPTIPGSVQILRPSIDDIGGRTVLRGIIAREALPHLRDEPDDENDESDAA